MGALVCVPLFSSAQILLSSAERSAAEKEALSVINRFTEGRMALDVRITLPKDSEGCDSYSYRTKGSTLFIEASSGVSACRAFYDYLKSKNAGICSWTGNRFEVPADIATSEKAFKSPYQHHQYMNVVTYGYTMPYWDVARWDKEIDWMALHGIDMPLVLLAQEQVYREVFYDMGLTKSEIDEWETGPAHLPWMRMGNISGNSFDGPLSDNWNKRQVELCKHVMKRMRRLGMKPICPAFGGFVPKVFVNHFKGKVVETGWEWVPDGTGNYRLYPDSESFVEIGTRFVKKWEEMFGKCTYYLSDSFNEMQIPQDKNLMTAYGDAIFRSIRNANPDAVWVMQGWTLGYQRSSWKNGIFEALLKNIPNDRFLLLDMATDYNRHFWHNSYNWEAYDGFYGKNWVWSVIPNMGGKTAPTGYIDYYANGRLDAMMSSAHSNLKGYGIAAEGVENNEIIYELITDAGWVGATDSIDVQRWMNNYILCRYGTSMENIQQYFNVLYESVYNDFKDHPQFGWQIRNNIIGKGSIRLNHSFMTSVENLFANKENLSGLLNVIPLQGASLLMSDLIEIAVVYAGARVEELNGEIKRLFDSGEKSKANALLKKLELYMLQMDRALMVHPVNNLEHWENQAVSLAESYSETKRNAVNARRIVSVWYGNHQKEEPVNDYSCRLWAGLIRDYYLPRLLGTWNRRINGIPFDQILFENSFVNKAPELSPAKRPSMTELLDILRGLVVKQ